VITVVFRSAFIRPHGGLLSNQTAFLESQPIHTIQEVLRRTLSIKSPVEYGAQFPRILQVGEDRFKKPIMFFRGYATVLRRPPGPAKC
jgi:hypothetical protein